MKTFEGQDLLDAVMGVPGWSLENGELVRVVSFDAFPDAIAFVNRVAELAEAAGHHPDIDIRYNRVKLVLVTHDGGGGITEKDIGLAKQVSGLLDA
jgi:4a-hydroxytetrahydrobiopterin dehydratase